MALQVDPALQAMPQRLQDEFRREVAGTRRGPIADAVLPLNGALIDRQRRIDALTAEVARLRETLKDWEEAVRKTWQMVDPLKPAGRPGSYARGHDQGIVDALTTLRANLKTPNVEVTGKPPRGAAGAR